MPTTEHIRAILDSNPGRQISVKFTKKSGKIRVLKFRPDDYLLTAGTGRKSPEDLFTVVDAEIREWRSFRTHQVLSILVSKD